MKVSSKKICLFYIAAIILIFFLIELCSAVYFRKTPFFTFKQNTEISEENHRLFSRLDPILAYTHSQNFEANQEEKNRLFTMPSPHDLGNGFTKLEWLDPSGKIKPLKIAVLGSSSSDPYLFAGNWPLKFHEKLIAEKKFHILFNGAVSGYNSFQLLNKLIRDVVNLEEIDLILVYFGGNDAPVNNDILRNFPAIHPYQNTLITKLQSKLDQHFIEASFPFFPNCQKLFSLIFKQMTLPPSQVQHGVSNSQADLFLLKNIKYMKAVADINHIKFYYFLETHQKDPQQKSTLTAPFNESKESFLGITRFLDQMEKQTQDLNFVFHLQSKMPLLPIYYDSVHLSEEGNKILAEKIYETVFK